MSQRIAVRRVLEVADEQDAASIGEGRLRRVGGHDERENLDRNVRHLAREHVFFGRANDKRQVTGPCHSKFLLFQALDFLGRASVGQGSPCLTEEVKINGVKHAVGLGAVTADEVHNLGRHLDAAHDHGVVAVAGRLQVALQGR